MVQVLAAVPKKKTFMQKLGMGVERGLEAAKPFVEAKMKEQASMAEFERKKEAMQYEYGLKGELEQQKYHEKLMGEERARKAEEENKKAMYSFGEKIKNSNPNNPAYQTIGDIYQSGLPADQTSQMVRALTGVDPFKVQQQQRLQLDSVLKRYNSRLKELDYEINNISFPRSTDKAQADALKQQRAALRAERDQLLDFKALNGFEDEDFEQDFDEEEDIGPEEEEDEEEGPKVLFDPNNKNHKAIAEKLFKQHKDKEKVRAILKKRFKGL